MESSQLFGGAEECHSSESGWTMYIGSSIDGENDGEHVNDPSDDDDDDNNNDNDDGNGDDNSDDSMASDAGSGPSHREQAWRNEEGGHGRVHSKVQEDKVNVKAYANKKDNKPVDKDRHGSRQEEKGGPMFNAEGRSFPVQSGEKEKRNSHGGKRK
ncbi:unnamed protein product [Ilex paraguariensis]|uniref:Uncharacterized protein n=1 Tax=Ilex paraguariensis TaxID=185542 RepID=A0ABC8RWE8_9AQUA